MIFIDVLITCPDRASAEAIARACVEERLAACANIGGDVTSIYRWHGAIERAGEVALYLKTRASLFDRLADRVKQLHPYDVPCIIAMELWKLDAAYAAWLEAETAE
ncbi:MAG TPA: divalent-cation tolerance protein CutA [Hyphomonadaceae bacterium]|nr:divalent-cation tolerance protein CutA [Hyphomonadaceae bacterium]